MKILLVIDQFDQGNNGTTISARRFAQALAADGNEVRVAAAGKPARGKYPMPEIHFLPVADSIIRSQGMVFAKPNRSVLEQAIAWADVVHFMMPFALSRVGLRIAKEMGKPVTAAFHVQPENITSTIHLGKNKKANELLYEWFRDDFYNEFTHIHCPSPFIAGQLKEHGYQAKLHIDDWTLFRRKTAGCFNRSGKTICTFPQDSADFGGTGTEGAQPALAGKVAALSSDHGIF